MSCELDCIQKAQEARLTSAQSKLKKLSQQGIPFDGPLSGFGGMEWKDTPREKIEQVLFIPVALILITFLALLVPAAYANHLWELHTSKQSLKKEIAAIMQGQENTAIPAQKSLESLWNLHGLEENRYSFNERFQLLSLWIEILYGENVSASLSLDQKRDSIITNHAEANRAYYEGNDDAPHFYFGDSINCLIRSLSRELPEYDRIV